MKVYAFQKKIYRGGEGEGETAAAAQTEEEEGEEKEHQSNNNKTKQKHNMIEEITLLDNTSVGSSG